jgi:hypothetical protein
MAIDKVNDILNRPVSPESVKSATSGKKEQVQLNEIEPEIKKTSLEDTQIFTEDAIRLQETEAILQNALQKLMEMDEINHKNLNSIDEKSKNNFYDSEEVLNQIVNEIAPDAHFQTVADKRIKAQVFVKKLNEMDKEDIIDEEKLQIIREKINSGFYNNNEVIQSIANNLIENIDL